MEPETSEQYLNRRLEQIRRGATEAIRVEVEWLERHNFPVWVWRDGRIVDATKEPSAGSSGGEPSATSAPPADE
jgi:hypothetical protein